MNLLKKILKHWYVLIGLLIFLYIILYQIDLPKLWETLLQANFSLVGLSILLVFVMLVLQPARWNYLKRIQKIKYSLRASFLIYNTGFFFSTITPGRIGDLIKVFYLKKDGHSMGKSLVSVIVDRLADLLFLLLVGYLSICLFGQLFLKHLVILTVIILVLLLLFFIFQRKAIIKKVFQWLVPKKYQKSWHLNYQDFIIGLKIYQLKNYFILGLITVANWFIYYLVMFLLAKSIGLDKLPFIFLTMSITMATLATLLPISILGLGTREATLLFLFSIYNISPETTISFSTLYLLVLLIASLVGLICWLKKPLRLKSGD